ncbi:MAG: hypothetical protein IKW96_04360 [Ruminococcus sp.]|uniref:sporulation initiation factor Spo0A C-terminal domain-containing protein n=1 Tax=Ruminococcus sp. TaxID=41978 RepID=UPI0025EC4D29|nr:sporulation initiation factor Spo0A C-terminal domain-containing protein [Ruminococcus sp.]MBR5682504.1 hypothetical protein [Ruminococcus sp.]
MKERILICDMSPSLGRLLVRSFINTGIQADFCRGSLSAIKNAMSKKKYSSLLFFAFSPDEQLLDFAKASAESGIKVFVGLYSGSASVHRSFRSAGVSASFTMPCSVRGMCVSVLMRIGNTKDILSQIEIFLEETGFPRRLKGFAYLAGMSTACLTAPERLWGGLSELYSETAEKLFTEPSLVERAVRNLSAHATENGSVSRLTEGRLTVKPTNTELICAVCDKFTRR